MISFVMMQASTSAESTQIAGPPNRQQLCHIGIANSLYALHRGVREVIHNITGVQPQDVPDIFEEIDVSYMSMMNFKMNLCESAR